MESNSNNETFASSVAHDAQDINALPNLSSVLMVGVSDMPIDNQDGSGEPVINEHQHDNSIDMQVGSNDNCDHFSVDESEDSYLYDEVVHGQNLSNDEKYDDDDDEDADDDDEDDDDDNDGHCSHHGGEHGLEEGDEESVGYAAVYCFEVNEDEFQDINCSCADEGKLWSKIASFESKLRK